MAKKPAPAKNVFVRNPDVVLREEDADGALLFNPDTNQVRVINTTGLFIWKRCDGKKSLPAIVASIKKEFEEVPAPEVSGQVEAFVADMRANGFLSVPGKKE